jgi:hypothetical protein
MLFYLTGSSTVDPMKLLITTVPLAVDDPTPTYQRRRNLLVTSLAARYQ